MAIVINHTKFALTVNSREFRTIIGPNSSEEVPEDVATFWSKKAPVKALIAQGGAAVRFGTAAPKAAPEAAPKAAPETPAKLHWRKRVAAVEAMEDLDALAALHAEETTPRVRAAIETRMSELQG